MSELDSKEKNIEEIEDVKDIEEESEDLLGEEIQLGGTPAGLATNEALRSMSRVARSFLIYDSRNEAIRGFLREYQRTMSLALSQYGEMVLEIRPFEMVRGVEIVYLERDRERSLAFRLFRDGVRRIVIDPDVEWEELLRLLEVLSIRFTGIRQQEDDIVTLLLKSGFKHIEIAAVEGFVPDDEDYCGDDPSARAARQARSARRVESHVEVPRDWDLPLPPPMPPVQLQYRNVSNEALQGLQEEGSSKALPSDTVRLLIEMLKVVDDTTDPTSSEDIDSLVQEVRDFLLAETQLSAVLDLVYQVDKLIRSKKEREAILSSFTNEKAIRRIISSLPKAVYEAPSELKELLDISPINHLPVLMDILKVERRENSRQIVRELIGEYLKGDAQKVLDGLYGFDDAVAIDLVLAVYEAKPHMLSQIIQAVSKRTDPAVQLKLIWMINKRLEEKEEKEEKEELSADIHEYLRNLLITVELEAVRRQALDILVRKENKEIFPVLEKMVADSKVASLEEAIHFGEAMSKAHATRARATFIDWLKPQKWYSLNRIILNKNQRWAAVAGISLLTGFDVISIISQIKEEADAQLSDFCVKMLVRRRHLGLDKKDEEGEAGQ